PTADPFATDRTRRPSAPAPHAAESKEPGIDVPAPFANGRYLAPQMRRLEVPVNTGRPKADVKPYSWSLGDVIERGLFSYLFAEDDVRDANFGALVLDLESYLTHERTERDGQRRRELAHRPELPSTFDELLGWVRELADGS